MVLLGLEFGIVQIHIDDQIQRADFFLCHIVFGYGNIRLANLCAFIRCQAHIVLGCICSGCNDLRSGMPGRSILELVLRGLEKQLGGVALAVIVHRQRENIFDFLINALLAGANIADPLKQFVKVICTEFLRIAKPFIIQHEALLHKLREDSACPPAEMNTDIAPHTIADSQDHIEIVEFPGAMDFSAALKLNL